MAQNATVITLVLVLFLLVSFSHCWLWPATSAQRTIIDDANCTVEDIDSTNNNRLFPIVKELVSKTFFKIFKVDLSSSCPFWAMKVMCGVEGGCSVCKCDEKDIPIPWKVSKKNPVNTFITKGTKKWVDNNKDLWFPKQRENQMTYVNLLLNPETNTGYSGSEASRVWKAIYTENCFKAGKMQDMCLEERVFFRLISGLHTSITLKIATYFHKKLPLPEENQTASKNDHSTYEMFLPNLDFFEQRILPFSDRLTNVYFLYTFTLRAIHKAAPYLSKYEYKTGNSDEDAQTKALLKQLLAERGSLCQRTFDESVLFKSSEKTFIRDQMRNHFRNISNIMDCVACEKCKMWAKLEMLGLATAFKIVLADEDFGTLQRNEIIALVVSFKQLSQSIADLGRLKTQLWRRSVSHYISYVMVASVVFVVLRLLWALCFAESKSKIQ